MNKLEFLSAGVLAAALLAACNAHAKPTNLIVSGGFETGDFTGWMAAPNSYDHFIESYSVQEGAYAAQIAGYSCFPDTSSQTIATVAGQAYQVSFWREHDLWGPTVSLNATWNGSAFVSELNPDDGAWQQITARVVGTGSDTLNFEPANGPGWTPIDKVSVMAVHGPATWALALLALSGSGVLRGVRKPSAAAA